MHGGGALHIDHRRIRRRPAVAAECAPDIAQTEDQQRAEKKRAEPDHSKLDQLDGFHEFVDPMVMLPDDFDAGILRDDVVGSEDSQGV